MTHDLVERLREMFDNWSLGSKGPIILNEAADRVESLERENDALRAEKDEIRKAVIEEAARAAEAHPTWIALSSDHLRGARPTDIAAAIRNMGERE